MRRYEPLPTIEPGVPLPSPMPSLKTLLGHMKIGDSVLVSKSRRLNLSKAANYQGYKVTARKEGDKWRVWRVK